MSESERLTITGHGKSGGNAGNGRQLGLVDSRRRVHGIRVGEKKASGLKREFNEDKDRQKEDKKV